VIVAHTMHAPPADTRTRILEAARTIYSRSGTKGTTTREVADLAGVNEATLFRHFGNKQALLDAMMERNSNAEEFYELLRNVPTELAPALSYLGTETVAKMRAKRAMIAISQAEDAVTPNASECAWRGPSLMVKALADFFQAFIDRGEMRGDAVFNARLFMGTFYSYIMAQKLWGPETHDDATVVAACVDLFLNGVQS
jgi:AcrR family transcriptional regulator